MDYILLCVVCFIGVLLFINRDIKQAIRVFPILPFVIYDMLSDLSENKQTNSKTTSIANILTHIFGVIVLYSMFSNVIFILAVILYFKSSKFIKIYVVRKINNWYSNIFSSENLAK